jgi:hypothetical protein
MGIAAAVPPGPDTCSNPGGPCPSSTLPPSPRESVLPWAQIRFPTGSCPVRSYFGETNGTATCVPHEYLPGGTQANPNGNTTCPVGSGLRIDQVTATLCTQDSDPYDDSDP